MATPTLDTSWYKTGAVARKPQGLCAPHIAQINLQGSFPEGAQSLTAETSLSLSSREKEKQEKGEIDKEGGEGDGKEVGG